MQTAVRHNIVSSDETSPIVIVGSGPVGIRVAQLLLQEKSEQKVVIYGNEPWEPYNRVQLSSFFAGELDWLGLIDSQRIPNLPNVTQIHNCEVVSINRDLRTITDAMNHSQHYSKLVMTTGSYPHVPNIQGINKEHIYCFRSLSDIEKLSARRTRSQKTVIVGGGLLGLEAARAMQRQNTDVVVVDHSPHLMSQQLDENAAELLREKLLALGIGIFLGHGVARFHGEQKVSAVELRDGRIIECDTIILATGIRPNIELARQSHISVGRGIRVNDIMQTSDPNIFAAGECAEHRGIVYGLVAPGYEQAGVVVNSLLQRKSRYQGSIAATKLKVVGEETFSMGEAIIGDDPGHFYNEIIYQPSCKGRYRKLVIKNHRLIGGIAIGDWEETLRIQEAINKKIRVWPWQIQRFKSKGMLWPNQKSKSVSQWPASTKVCQCMGVNRGQISRSIQAGNNSIEAIQINTGASSVCGGCKPLIADMLGTISSSDKLAFSSWILIVSLLAMATSIGISVLPTIQYQESVFSLLEWDSLWRDKTIKQVTGYSILGFTLLGLVFSFIKRLGKNKASGLPGWRLNHVAVGLLVIVILAMHTGFRFGENINFYLMVNFVGLLIIGSLAGILMAKLHLLDAVQAIKIKNGMLLVHILLVWPLPVLLAFHILQTYYF